MYKVTKDYSTLYQWEDPELPVQLLDTHIDPFQIIDEVPTEAEVEAAVQCPRSLKAGGKNNLRVERFNTWICEAYPYKVVNPPPPQSSTFE